MYIYLFCLVTEIHLWTKYVANKKIYLHFFSLTIQSLLKSKKNKTEKNRNNKPHQSWFKKNKKNKPIKYDVHSMLGKDGLHGNPFKWYYPVKTETTRKSTDLSRTTATSSVITTIRTTTTTPGAGIQEKSTEIMRNSTSDYDLSPLKGNYN